MRRWGVLVVAILVIAAAALILSSNLTRQSSTVRFLPGGGGMNTMELTAPSGGWHCIEYQQLATSSNTSSLEVLSKGRSECPLFGAAVYSSTDYPDSGVVENIPLEEPVLVYQNEAGTYQVYVLITRDRTRFDRIEEEK